MALLATSSEVVSTLAHASGLLTELKVELAAAQAARREVEQQNTGRGEQPTNAAAGSTFSRLLALETLIHERVLPALHTSTSSTSDNNNNNNSNTNNNSSNLWDAISSFRESARAQNEALVDEVAKLATRLDAVAEAAPRTARSVADDASSQVITSAEAATKSSNDALNEAAEAKRRAADAESACAAISAKLDKVAETNSNFQNQLNQDELKRRLASVEARLADNTRVDALEDRMNKAEQAYAPASAVASLRDQIAAVEALAVKAAGTPAAMDQLTSRVNALEAAVPSSIDDALRELQEDVATLRKKMGDDSARMMPERGRQTPQNAPLRSRLAATKTPTTVFRDNPAFNPDTPTSADDSPAGPSGTTPGLRANAAFEKALAEEKSAVMDHPSEDTEESAESLAKAIAFANVKSASKQRNLKTTALGAFSEQASEGRAERDRLEAEEEERAFAEAKAKAEEAARAERERLEVEEEERAFAEANARAEEAAAKAKKEQQEQEQEQEQERQRSQAIKRFATLTPASFALDGARPPSIFSAGKTTSSESEEVSTAATAAAAAKSPASIPSPDGGRRSPLPSLGAPRGGALPPLGGSQAALSPRASDVLLRPTTLTSDDTSAKSAMPPSPPGGRPDPSEKTVSQKRDFFNSMSHSFDDDDDVNDDTRTASEPTPLKDTASSSAPTTVPRSVDSKHSNVTFDFGVAGETSVGVGGDGEDSPKDESGRSQPVSARELAVQEAFEMAISGQGGGSRFAAVLQQQNQQQDLPPTAPQQQQQQQAKKRTVAVPRSKPLTPPKLGTSFSDSDLGLPGLGVEDSTTSIPEDSGMHDTAGDTSLLSEGDSFAITPRINNKREASILEDLAQAEEELAAAWEADDQFQLDILQAHVDELNSDLNKLRSAGGDGDKK